VFVCSGLRRIRVMQQLKFEFCAHDKSMDRCDGQGRQNDAFSR
jgi:hypothetical protein